MGEPRIEYDFNSHIFRTYTKTGRIDPVKDIIVYDGGDMEEMLLEEEEEENEQ